ncbi:hypothetical protein RHMOL_Rhmol10G0134200 [Rhododendron molle]|uniref:Uncharacterized protein n=1 Tax=Rhododendron molle TaxID=49168 RepID=A0ACC0M3E2_RHOML|nr:hypothetical protein RHMOL_Rhmol10G0134200 [Rhododendron molle]
MSSNIIFNLFLPMNQMLGGSGLRTQCHIVTFCILLHNLIKRTIETHPQAKGINGKAFPMYESWQMLFGRDRATGEIAEDAAKLDNVQADPVETLSPNDLFDEYYTPSFANGDPTFVDISTSAGTPTSFANPTTPRTNVNIPAMNVVPERPKKKANVDAKEVSINDAFGNFMAQNSTAFLKIVDSVGYEDRLFAKKEKVFSELVLQLIDMFSAHAIIVSAEENVDTFFGILENYRQA